MHDIIDNFNWDSQDTILKNKKRTSRLRKIFSNSKTWENVSLENLELILSLLKQCNQDPFK